MVLVFCCCHKIPWEKQPIEGKVYLVSQLQRDRAQRSKESMTTECERKQEEQPGY